MPSAISFWHILRVNGYNTVLIKPSRTMSSKQLLTGNSDRDKYSPSSFIGEALQLSDVGQLSAIFHSWHGRFDQLTPGHFTAELQVVAGDSVRAITISANRRIHARGGETSSVISFYPVTHENANSLWHGHRLSPGQLVVHGPGAETDHCSARTSVIRGISIRPELLLDATRVFLNRDDVVSPPAWDVQTLPPRIMATFLRAHDRLITRGTLRRPRAHLLDVRRIEQECLRSVVESLSHGSPASKSLTLPARTRLIRRAEEFMRSRISDPFGALDLCRELGVSDRTLRLVFRERYGLGPMTYFKLIRLNAVRTLIRANSDLHVSAIARACGFRHLGNFAADYFRLFGERPMDTSGKARQASFTRSRA
jgi:AraC family ethanolamine operon transcriptional activator